jgi:rubrerythrin
VNAPALDLAAAIDLAMQAEREAEEFYAAAAQATTEPRGRDMFEKLAQFERHHFTSLQRLRESLGQGAFAGYAGAGLLPEQPAAPARPLDDGQRQNDLEALTGAIDAETKAQAMYRELAAQALDAPVRRMFEKLAEEEELHRKVLEDQFYALTNQGRWIWGD